LDIELTDILGVYSDPQRDPRGHIMSTVFIGRVLSNENAKNKAIAQDDASHLEWIDLQTVGDKSLAFDHKIILSNYKKWRVWRHILVNKEMIDNNHMSLISGSWGNSYPLVKFGFHFSNTAR
jgi:hypothetical protein